MGVDRGINVRSLTMDLEHPAQSKAIHGRNSRYTYRDEPVRAPVQWVGCKVVASQAGLGEAA
eukprot:scaffold75396_cov33-Phaeocystis_antarctica.AAC.2